MENSNRLYTVVIADRAKDMLLEHVRFVAQCSPQGANELRIKVVEAVKSLEHLPGRHPWLTDPMIPAHKYKKMVIDKRYIVIYQVKAKSVYVDYVVDCRQNYQWLLQ